MAVGTDPDQGTAETRSPDTLSPPGRRPWWVWAVPFAVLFAVLCARNRLLFTTRLYEQGDAGANSILIEQARHFTLLVGNYSREHFNHPGPAYMYVQAAGEYLFQNTLHVVPTAWNAHMLSVFALDCAFVALATGIAYGWTRSLRGAAACLAVFTGFVIAYPWILNSDWMPHMYVLAYMVFIMAAGSVAAGRMQDAWIFALTGWFLIHGHACFLLFVPAVTAAVLVAVLWPRRDRLGASARGFFRDQRRNWIPVAVISALFVLPILVNLALHWPGEFGKYISYGGSGRAGGHGARQVIEYALWFWWPHRHAWLSGLAPLLGYPAALAAVRWLCPARLRGFLLGMLAVNVVSSLAFLLYAAVGIDDLTEYYIGYFYWSAPLIMVLVIVLAGFEALPLRGELAARLSAAAALAAAAAGVAVLAVAPGTRTGSTNDIDQALPRVVATLAARAPGRMIVLRIDRPAWVETTGFLVQAERSGVRACLADPWFTFMMTRQFICTPAQAASGRAYWFYTRGGLPPHAQVLLRFSGVAVVPSSP